MTNRRRVKKMFHVRYVAEFLVSATSAKQAFEYADEQMIDMVEGDERGLDEIFNITVENSQFHVIEEIPEDELVDDEDEDDENGDDEDGDDEDGDDDEDEDEE